MCSAFPRAASGKPKKKNIYIKNKNEKYKKRRKKLEKEKLEKAKRFGEGGVEKLEDNFAAAAIFDKFFAQKMH